MRKGILLLITQLIITITSYSQEVNFELNGQSSIPIGEFGENTRQSMGIGAGGSLLFNIAESPVNIGITGGYLWYEQYTINDKVIKMKDYYREGDLTSNNNIIHSHLVVRLKPYFGKNLVQLYAEGLFGFKYLYTRSKVKLSTGEDSEIDGEVTGADTNLSSFNLSYGAGIGLMLRPSDEFSLNIGVQYLMSTPSEYGTGVDVDTKGNVNVNTENTTTDMLIPTIGLNFYFGT